MLKLLHIYCERLNLLEFLYNWSYIVASKQLGPWPLPDTTLFNRLYYGDLVLFLLGKGQVCFPAPLPFWGIHLLHLGVILLTACSLMLRNMLPRSWLLTGIPFGYHSLAMYIANPQNPYLCDDSICGSMVLLLTWFCLSRTFKCFKYLYLPSICTCVHGVNCRLHVNWTNS